MKVEVKSLKVDLDEVLILEGVNLKVKEGEFFGIVGKNGSGKTTLLRTLAKFYPKEGSIYIDGRELEDIKLDELARIVGVVPQEFELNVNFTVEQFVALGRIPYIRIFESEKDREVVNRVIDSLKCPKNRIVRTLSGGEKQKVLIAKALAQEPKVLLLDEPTSHLDIKHQIEIVKILKSLAKRGLTIIATFHDLNLALNFCDRIAIMKDGRVLKVCKPDEVDSDVLREAFEVEVEVVNLNGWKVVIPKV